MNTDTLELIANMNKYNSKIEKSFYLKDGKRFMEMLGHTFVWEPDAEIYIYYKED